MLPVLLDDGRAGPPPGPCEPCAWMVLSAVLEAAETWPLREALPLAFAEDRLPGGSALRFAWGLPGAAESGDRAAGIGLVLPPGFGQSPEGREHWEAGFKGMGLAIMEGATRLFLEACLLGAPPLGANRPVPFPDAFCAATSLLGGPPDLVLASELSVSGGLLDQEPLAHRGVRLIVVGDSMLGLGVVLFALAAKGDVCTLGEVALCLPEFLWRNDSLPGYHCGEVRAHLACTLDAPERVCSALVMGM